MNLSKSLKIGLTLGLLLMAINMTGCSSATSWVTGASLTTSTANGIDTVDMSLNLNTGSMQLIPIALPIYNPKNPSQLLGELQITTTGLTLSLDLNTILNLPSVASNGLLPNGTAIPVTNVSSTGWIEIPVNNGNSMIYVNFDSATKTAAVGVAVNVSALAIGVPADLLLPFSFSNIAGDAGIYTGATASQSGFAAFVDASSLIGTTAVAAAPAPVAAGAVQVASFVATNKSSAKIQTKVIQLNMASAKLKAQ